MRSTEIVTAFWNDVWNAHDADALGRFAADDIVIEAGGQKISGIDDVERWVQQFLDHVNDLHINPLESFQNEDGTRVTSRWVLTGTNNGILGTEPNGKPIAMTGKPSGLWPTASCSTVGSNRPRSSCTTRYSRSNTLCGHDSGGGPWRRARAPYPPSSARRTPRPNRSPPAPATLSMASRSTTASATRTRTRTPSPVCRASTWTSNSVSASAWADHRPGTKKAAPDFSETASYLLLLLSG